jgi:hypothetical protein
MSEMSAGLALGDELSAALAQLSDTPLAVELPNAEPAVDAVFEITCGAARVVLRLGESVLIGRAPSGQASTQPFLGIDHRLVSRRHVIVHRVDGELVAEDVGSRNGTALVRGATSTQLVGPTVLVDGDRLCTVNGVELGHVAIRPSPTPGRRR